MSGTIDNGFTPVSPYPNYNGLVPVADADVYFSLRMGADQFWVSGINKAAALMTAQNQITAAYGYVNDPNCVCEQALFLIRDRFAEARNALQAQNVKRAGVIDETYGDGARGCIAICPYVREVMGAPDAAMNIVQVTMDNNIEIIVDQDVIYRWEL